MNEPKIGTIHVYWPEDPSSEKTALLCKAFDPGQDDMARVFARKKQQNDMFGFVFAGKLESIRSSESDGTVTKWQMFEFK